MKKPVRLNEIAAAAGVTAATVSLALSGKPGPAEETRRKIRSVARRLGYRKDPYAAILAANRRRTLPRTPKSLLAFITSHRTPDGWSNAPNFAIYHGSAKRRAAELGYGLETFWVGRQGENAKRVSEILYNRGIKGVLLAPLPNGINGYELTWEPFHTVTLGFSFTEPFLHRVSCDHLQAMRTSVRRCHKLGYRRIGFVVTRRSNERVDQRWLASYLLEQRQLQDATPLPPLVIDQREDTGFFDWLDREKPDVVLAYAGDIFLKKVRDSGRLVPKEIGFVSLNLPNTNTPVSGIYENPERIGRQAVDLLVGGLDRGEHGIPDHPNIFLSEPTWIPGDTLKNDRAEVAPLVDPDRGRRNGGKSVSMRDVADLVGVHPTTVSLALRGHSRIPEKTRALVENAANQLGYRKNPLITELMRQRRQGNASRKRPGLGFLITFPTKNDWKTEYPLLSQYQDGARLRAKALGFSFEGIWLPDPSIGIAYGDRLAAKNVRGLLIPPLAPNLKRFELNWNSFCHVSVGFALDFPRIHRVATDTYRSMKKAIRESIRRGYRRIGLAVSARITHYVQDRWLASFLMQRHEHTDLLIPRYHILKDDNPDTFRTWLNDERPDLILTPQADELLKYLSVFGYQTPNDIDIVSLDRQSNDRLSGIDQNGRMIGSRAVDLLVGLIEKNEYGIPEHPTTLLIDGKWCVGRSTRPLPQPGRQPENQSDS
jgi:LacI family transcriptional regulator